MASEEKKIPTFGPNIFSTQERLRARLNTFYQSKSIIHYGTRAKITKEDLAKYYATFPEEAEQLQKLDSLRKFTGYGSALGFFGGGASILRMTKAPPLILVGVFLTTASAHLVADDIGSWIYGTYKFDNAAANERFVKWVYESKR